MGLSKIVNSCRILVSPIKDGRFLFFEKLKDKVGLGSKGKCECIKILVVF